MMDNPIVIPIDLQSLAVHCGIAYLVCTLSTWGLIGILQRLKIPVHFRIKAAMPVLFAFAYFFFYKKIGVGYSVLFGVIIGAIASTLYDWFVDKIFAAIEGILGTAVEKIKSKINNS
jgi:hypothetical protein